MNPVSQRRRLNYRMRLVGGIVIVLLLSNALAFAQTTQGEPEKNGRIAHDTSRGDKLLKAYFAGETQRLSENCLADIKTLDDWQKQRATLRQQLFEMLSLDPLPPKTDLRPVVTGKLEHEEFTVEKLHFQSLPKLYVTANLYLSKGESKPCPAILYLCGHGREFKNGVAYGNKNHYQHHGEWFARHGYVCLVIDTVQLGEIEGHHHGTYKEGQWWWNNLGYTPAGVEAGTNPDLRSWRNKMNKTWSMRLKEELLGNTICHETGGLGMLDQTPEWSSF